MKSIRLAFMGDLTIPEMPQKVNIKTDSDYLYDFAVCNLEGSCKTNRPLRKLANLYNSPEALETMMHKLGIRYVNLANNHVMDFGEKGLLRLMETLDDIRVQYFGAGRTYSEAMKPVLVSMNGVRLGLIGFSWKPIESVGATQAKAGVALIPPENKLCDAVADLRRDCDHVVVSFHWGYEYERYPLPLHRKLAHAVVDAGASVVIGHHPHVYQGAESYKGGIIYYSLGNFYMPRPQKSQADVGIVPIVKFGPNSVQQLTVLHSVRDRPTETLVLLDSYDPQPSIKDLSLMLNADDVAYQRFFRSNRVRRKGLPVFTGSRMDTVRYAWLDARSRIVRISVRLGLR